MFYYAKAFNQDLSNWDVSSGTSFVSNDQGIQFDLLHSLIQLCQQVLFKLQYIIDWWLLTNKHSQPTNCVFHYILELGLYVLFGQYI